MVPDHWNFIRTSKYPHLLVPMSTNIFTNCWWRTYWVLRYSNFCLGPPKFDNLVDRCPIKLSAILSQPQPAQCHINDSTTDTSSWCHILIECNFITKLQIKTISNPLSLFYMVHVSINVLYLFNCDQAALWMAQSICPSVCLDVWHLFHYVIIIVSSWSFLELLPMTEVMSMQKVKVRGQRLRSQRSQHSLTVSGP